MFLFFPRVMLFIAVFVSVYHLLNIGLVVWSDLNLLFLNLQPGWEERVHADGRTFYIDHSKDTLNYDIYV